MGKLLKYKNKIMSEGTISKTSLYLIMTGMLVTGTANTLFSKIQDETTALDQTYTHPYLQTAVMFFGEFLCLPAYGVKLWLEGRSQKKKDAAEGGLLMSPGM